MEMEDGPGVAPERKLTVADVAQQEAVSKKTIHNWIEAKVLTPAYRVGKIIRFTPEGVARDLAAANNNRGGTEG